MPHAATPADTRRRARALLLNSASAATGLWEDFASTAGSSREWVSAFVLWGLGARAAEPVAAAAREALRAQQRADGSWGFCAKVPGDTDSTAWAVLGLGPCLPARGAAAARQYLLDQQLPSGGFRTYADAAAEGLDGWAPRDRGYAGWLSAHTCVTAAAVRALLALGGTAGSAPLARATAYLARRRDTSGVWPSYWWSGVTYATYQSLYGLSRCGALSQREAAAAAAALAARELPGGGWSWDGSTHGRAGAFETAFALLALHVAGSASELSPQARACMARGVDWLRATQHADGRWPVEPILRVPLPSDPREQLGASRSAARPGGLGGDVNGVFTAAAVVRCLGAFPGNTRSSQSRPARPGPPLPRKGPAVSPVVRFLVTHEGRTAFARAMTGRGLGISPGARATVLAADQARGSVIARGLPRPEAAPGAPSVVSGSLFAAPWRAKIVSMLAFGVGAAEVLAAAQGLLCPPEAVELAAVLVLGTAAFDRVCDENPRLRAQLFATLAREVLDALCAGDLSPGDADKLVRTARHADVRYVLSLVAAFFARLASWVPPGPVRTRVSELLRSAYDAELVTVSPEAAESADAVAAAVAARVLPFTVITTVTCALAGHGCDGGPGWSCDQPATLLGQAMASLDDLADLCMDARTGAVNSLLTAARTPGADASDPSGLLVQLLASGACWDAAEAVAQRLADYAARLPPEGVGEQVTARTRLLAHTWGWGSLGDSPAASATGRWGHGAPAPH